MTGIPELWADYFGHYRRLVWLTQSPHRRPGREAEAVAAQFGLPLTVIEAGTGRLERELESLWSERAVSPSVRLPGGGAAAGPA